MFPQLQRLPWTLDDYLNLNSLMKRKEKTHKYVITTHINYCSLPCSSLFYKMYIKKNPFFSSTRL